MGEDNFRILDVMGIDEMIDRIAFQLPEISETRLASGFRRFLNSHDSVGYIFYSRSQALGEAERLIREFVRECKLPVNKAGFVEEETFAGRVARETGLTLVGEPAITFFYRSIDGSW